jgi:hypothetical protein
MLYPRQIPEDDPVYEHYLDENDLKERLDFFRTELTLDDEIRLCDVVGAHTRILPPITAPF